MKKFLSLFILFICLLSACNKTDKPAEENKMVNYEEYEEDEFIESNENEGKSQSVAYEYAESDEEEIPYEKETSKEEQFIDAINYLEVQKVKELIENGINVNFTREERRRVSGFGPTIDAYELVFKTPLDYALERGKNIKENIEKLKQRFEQEKADSLLPQEKIEEKYGNCIVCEGPDPESVSIYLSEEMEREKKINEIIKLLKAAAAKE